jgi:hypothetical protein
MPQDIITCAHLVWGLGFRVSVYECGLGCGVWDLSHMLTWGGFRVGRWDLSSRVQGLGFRHVTPARSCSNVL